MLRYRADARTLVFVGTYFSLVALQWLVPVPWYLAVPLFVATCAFSFLGAVITHNTVHCPVFFQKGLNRALQVVLSLTYGHPVSTFVPGHNLSHHKHTQSYRDVMRTSKVRFRSNFLNFLFFMPTVANDITRNDIIYARAMYKERPRWFRQLLLEGGVVVLFTVGLLLLDWKKWLLYWQLPHMYAAWGIISMNYLQHDGCDPNHPYNHSRNFVGWWVNWWTFNNGYHGIHHEHPGLHWSLLPEAHNRLIKPHLHPALDQPSMLSYGIKAYLWPAKRLTFDGQPVELPPKAPDQNWIPGRGNTPLDVSLGAEA